MSITKPQQTECISFEHVSQASSSWRVARRGAQVTEIRSDAMFILLVEKDAAFMRLAEDRFYNTYPCIILTAKGQPDVATRCEHSIVTVTEHLCIPSGTLFNIRHQCCESRNYLLLTPIQVSA